MKNGNLEKVVFVISSSRFCHPSKLSVATLDLMKKKLKKNPALTASQMKMRMRIEEVTTNLYTEMMNKLLF
jgi:hypothetical protein